MQNIQTELGSQPQIRGWPLGYLMEPIGWAGQQLARLAGEDPASLTGLLSISKARMHVIALVLAQAQETDLSISLADLLGQRLGDVLVRLRPAVPAGLKGVVRRLPNRVLNPGSYRLLLSLMADPDVARLLAHGPEIDDRRLQALADTPPALRPVAMATMEGELDALVGLTESLAWLAARRTETSDEGLIADLAGRRQPRQLVARLRRLVEDLPVPQIGPPDVVGAARRIDSPPEVRQLAKAWRNCLVTFQHRIDDGRCVVYRWPAPVGPALALVERHGRLGWFLEQVKGPNNRDLPAEALEVVEDEFAGAGVPAVRLAAPLEALIAQAGERRFFD